MTTRARHPASWLRRRPVRAGFTLVELLVVITIVILVSAVALPTIIPALSSRQVGEAARLLQGALVGARDAAIRSNAPRGIRLLPDSLLFTAPTTATGPSGTFRPGVLTYSRILPIEPAPDYTEGQVQIVGDAVFGTTTAPGTTYYARYPVPVTSATQLPVYPGALVNWTGSFLPPDLTKPIGSVLRIEESAFSIDAVSGGLLPNSPTSWWWNIRLGDKIRVGDSGRWYTIVGPITIHPRNPVAGVTNPELYVNDGLPANVRTQGNLPRTYSSPAGTPTTVGVEFLYLVNGQDDDGDGYVDDGWDNLDNDFNTVNDDLNYVLDPTGTFVVQIGEWETEVWLGALGIYNDPRQFTGSNAPYSLTSPSPAPPLLGSLPYVIARRPVPSPSAREMTLPGPIVIDATTWNTTSERSRLPVDPNNFTVDILLDQAGQVVPSNGYSSPASFGITSSFYHFWLTDRGDVYAPAPFTPGTTVFPTLPFPTGSAMPSGPGHDPTLSRLSITNVRQLLTLEARTGAITTTSLENFSSSSANRPYLESQLGITEPK